jgi:hypothetical protein
VPEKNDHPHLGESLNELLQDVEELSHKVKVLRAEVEEIREDFHFVLQNRQSISSGDTIVDETPVSDPSIETIAQDGPEESVTSLLADNLEERTQNHEEWVKTVRDPASEMSEGERIQRTKGNGASAKYEIAQLPDSQWAIRTSFSYDCGNICGNATPWSEFPTREECINQFMIRANSFFDPEIDSTGNNRQRQARQEMLELLKGGLFGFVEPDPQK